MDYFELVSRQRDYYFTGATRSYEARRDALLRLRDALRENEEKLAAALREDLNKSPSESYLCETGLVLEEISFCLRRLRGWMREKRVKTPLSLFPGRSFTSPEPYGVVLILSPWNYPVQLCLSPLVGALAAGNCAVVKPSAKAPAVSRALAELLRDAFDEKQVAVAEGGREDTGALLTQKWDYIFFTGSAAVGREVLAAAAKNLTPVSLELGGKSPVVIDPTADLRLAARRVAFGKCLNAGQTCVAPDYVLIHESVRDRFVEEYRRALEKFFPKGDRSDFPKIISDRHFARITGLMDGEKAAVGGGSDAQSRFIEPTLLVDVTPEAPVMQEEVFGPVLPVLTWTDIGACIDFIRSRPKPLALYLFTGDRTLRRRVLDSCSFGGGCVNDAVMHLATPRLPFGGVGESGMGSYHGKASFDTFSHSRSVLDRKLRPDVPLRYRPYGKLKARLVKRFLK